MPAPIQAAYAGALDNDCPGCGAAVQVHCSRPDGRLRRTPCLDRLRMVDCRVRGDVCAVETPPRGYPHGRRDLVRQNDSQPPLRASHGVTSENTAPTTGANQVAPEWIDATGGVTGGHEK